MATAYRTRITLTEEQMAEAAEVSRKLHDAIRARGGRDAHGLRAKDATREMEDGGAAAEMAAALMLGVPWSASLPGHGQNGPDIGTRTQVRSSNVRRASHHLIVRDRDISKYGDTPFVLVIQQDRTFRILGWMMSHEARRIGRVWDGGDRSRPPAYFVHQSYLLPIETLEGI